MGQTDHDGLSGFGIVLVPFRADLYRLRAEARSSAGDAKGAAADRKIAATLEGGNR